MGRIIIDKNDNVEISFENGHKYALKDINCGEEIIKYGFPIGRASASIKKGELIHSHNLSSSLKGLCDYKYEPSLDCQKKIKSVKINSYIRKNGDIGIRNDIWIIVTVGCINKTAQKIADLTGTFCFTHPYGCSRLGSDLKTTQMVLRGLITHPNAGGALVLGLGCENNNIGEMKKILGPYDEERIRFLNCQDCEDEIAEGVRLVNELQENASKDIRRETDISKLIIGLKCGGSDGLSGITANPMCGKITDKIIAMGGSAALTEVPEMFGAEQILMNRCLSRELFEKMVRLINDYKKYFILHNQSISENPSPGNKKGGVTTLEEKSLGCIRKGGKAPVVDILDYGDKIKKSGLNLLNGPGNDIIAVTNLTAAGCHIILFTTGRGTPLGAPVPTLKISTNTNLYNKKPHWIDFDAQSMEEDELFNLIVDTADGKLTKNEENGYREISIFKDGVIL